MAQKNVLVTAMTTLLVGATPTVSAVDDQNQETKQAGKATKMTKSQLEARGIQLRAAIDETYRKLDKSGSIRHQGTGRNFITDIVIKHVPIGTSFDDAEAILQSAGFQIRPRIPNMNLPDAQRYDQVAIIDQYAPTPLGKTSVSVSLRPRGPQDYSVVVNVSAEITRTYP